MSELPPPVDDFLQALVDTIRDLEEQKESVYDDFIELGDQSRRIHKENEGLKIDLDRANRTVDALLNLLAEKDSKW